MNRLGLLVVLVVVWCATAQAQGPALQDQLLREGAASLAKAARAEGDPQRGAIVFHQPFLACVKCHAVGSPSSLQLPGPDLTKPEPNTTAEALIESVLLPSKVLRKGFEPIVIQTTDGKTITGILVSESPEGLVLRDATRPGETVSIARSSIEDRATSATSIMPAGQVNVLANRGQFLDLARYLIEIAEQGPERARQLQPPPSLFAFVLPEYEKQVDHAGLLQDLDAKSLKRGEAIYNRLCINCHGTKDQPGSLPTSLRFATGKFKNGFDPYRMYQTLTHGFGLMMPQTWMVPQQKYDVIHYVRETYLKPDNPSQYAAIDATYLASLPKGNTRGPAPSNVEPWSTMNYGPFLTATYEVSHDGSNFAHKGIAVRLDPGPGGVSRGKHWQVFDHDTLRIAAAWSREASGKESDSPNFIDWQGINFDGRHQAHPHVAGKVWFANPTGPGWADPETGSFEDPRIVGRDKKHYGPLPRTWGQYLGLYQFGDQAIVSYTVGSTGILEMPGVVDSASTASVSPVFTRTFQVGSRSRPMVLKVATQPDGPAYQLADAGPIAVLRANPAESKPQAGPIVFGEKTSVQIQKSEDFDLTGKDFSITARIKTRSGGTILCQAPIEGPWAPDGKTLFVRGGRLAFDIGWVGAVTGKTKVDDDKWHDVTMTWQHESGRVRLFVDGKPDGQGTLKPKSKAARQTIRIGYTAANFPDPTYFAGQMAQVRFVQQTLSDDDVARLAAASADEAEAFWQGKQLTAHWDLSAPGETIRDLTGKGHEGKLIGAGGLASGPLAIAAGLSPMPEGAKWMLGNDHSLLLSIPAGNDPLRFVLSTIAYEGKSTTQAAFDSLTSQPPLDLVALTKGGPRRWLEELTTPVVEGPDQGPYAVDILSIPANNPWFAQFRPTGFDFSEDGTQMAVCTWDGDVWLVRENAGQQGAPRSLKWRRIANGLFQPLGLKISAGRIYVTCRDQIAILQDLNGDGETDFIECFNNDHQVTEHFHEFAMGLQQDEEGNFYYAKSARHALPAVVPHHGTLLKVSRDGSQTEILANGFRAANGVCLNPDGTFVVTDQEGHWNPKNRINWVIPAKPGEKPRFYGNLFGYTDVTDPSDSAMQPPLCWITNAFDRSPAELLWVTSDKWGPLKGSLLNLSYGYGKVFVVPFERVGKELVQGGLCELPLPTFPTGIMRGRFHPVDGQLYTCGMFAWAGNATAPGGFYRIRATGRPVHVPTGLVARKQGMQITFSGSLDAAVAVDPTRYQVRTWSLKRTADYGSKHYDEKTLTVASVKLSQDRQTVTLELPDIQPTWCMSIQYQLKGSDGEIVNGLVHNTIHKLGE